MPKSRRQQKQERRRLKRKEKREQMRRQSQSRSIKSIFHDALDWPVLGCWVNEEWEDPKFINQVVVARQDPDSGEVAAASYLVDRACLGVKNAMYDAFPNSEVFADNMLSIMEAAQVLVKIDFKRAAAIVKAGLEFAEELGFKPHKDYKVASILLKDAEVEELKDEIPVGGPDGKPYFIAGPYDNVDKIMQKLLNKLGPGGFYYLAPVDGPEGLPGFEDLSLPEE